MFVSLENIASLAISVLVATGVMVGPVTVGSTAPILSSPLQHVSIPVELNIDKSVPGLSDASAAAAEYVNLASDAWAAQVKDKYFTQSAADLTEKANAAKKIADDAAAAADVAKGKAEKSKQDILEMYRETIVGGIDTSSPTISLLLSGPENAQEVIAIYRQAAYETERRNVNASTAYTDRLNAEDAAKIAEAKRVDSANLAADAQNSLNAAHEAEINSDKLLSDSLTKWTAIWTVISQQDSNNSGVPLGTRIFDQALITKWNSLLDEINATGIVPPNASDLFMTSVYPESIGVPLSVFPEDATGIGTYKNTMILSKEAIIRVGQALSNLGKNYIANGSGTDGWGCESFIAQVTEKPSTTTLNQIYETAGRQNKSLYDTTPGDIVFFADPQAGIHQAGVFVLGGFVIDSSASSSFVSASSIGPDAIASVRPNTRNLWNVPAPVKLPGSLNWKCDGVEYTGKVDATAGWALPMPKGTYDLGSSFGENVDKFIISSSVAVPPEGNGKNPGLEFLAHDSNQVVVADFDGTVTEVVQNDPIWGSYVTISHSPDLSTRYSGLSFITVDIGAKVVGGSPIGVVGTTGQTTTVTPGVLVTITMSGSHIDPRVILFPVKIGLYSNGQIPASALCPLQNGGLLRCDAARAFSVLASAYEKEIGSPIQITDTYRSLSGQITCRAEKGDMCAIPGTSNHGWGLATDLGGGIQTFGTPEYKWMVNNALKYGWYHPSWADSSGAKPEPWHWEYIATK